MEGLWGSNLCVYRERGIRLEGFWGSSWRVYGGWELDLKHSGDPAGGYIEWGVVRLEGFW